MRHVDYIQNDWLGHKQILAGRITLRDGPAASRPALIVESMTMGGQAVQILWTHMANLQEELYTQGTKETDYLKRVELLACSLPFLLERMAERYDGSYFFCSSLHTADACSFKDRIELPMKRTAFTKGAFSLPALPEPTPKEVDDDA